MTAPSSSALIDTQTATASAETKRKKLSSRNRWYIVAGAFVAFCLVRWATGASQFTSVGSVAAALVFTIPIAMAGLAGVWSERAGIVNIGLEGMLIAGTIFGAWMGVKGGPWAGVIAAIAGAAAVIPADGDSPVLACTGAVVYLVGLAAHAITARGHRAAGLG